MKHGKENYYVYIWSERIYIARVKDRHQMVSCLLVDIELIENDNDRLIPLVLYERRNPLESASNNSQFKERALYEPVRFFFEPVDQESVFDASKAIQWLTIRRQWIFELTQLLTNDRAKLKYYRRPGDDKCVQTVRDFYGLNRVRFRQNTLNYLILLFIIVHCSEPYSIDLSFNVKSGTSRSLPLAKFAIKPSNQTKNQQIHSKSCFTKASTVMHLSSKFHAHSPTILSSTQSVHFINQSCANHNYPRITSKSTSTRNHQVHGLYCRSNEHKLVCFYLLN